MPRDWKRIAESDGEYAERDFQNAAYRLMTEQVLYERHKQQRRSYDIVRKHLPSFTEAVALYGCRLEINTDYGYVYVIHDFPLERSLKLEVSLLALTLRKLYHQGMLECRSQRGVVDVDLDELRVCYEDTTKRSFPDQAQAVRDLIGPLRRVGLARIGETPVGNPQPFFVQIMPAIADLLSEAVLARITAEAMASVEVKPSPDSDAIDTDEE